MKLNSRASAFGQSVEQHGNDADDERSPESRPKGIDVKITENVPHPVEQQGVNYEDEKAERKNQQWQR